MAYVDAVATDADAVEAIGAMPGFMPLVDPLDRDTEMDAAIGYAYLRAGRLDEARGFLLRATRSCWALDIPLAHTQAHLYLGELNERSGDVAGACSSYAVVLSRWEASGESRSAARARQRSEALKCPHHDVAVH
jgi:serine/threonine-protein kinase